MNARRIVALAVAAALTTLGGCNRARGSAWNGYPGRLTVAVAAAALPSAPQPTVVPAPPALSEPPLPLTGTQAMDAASQQGVEVLTSGPVHEAFAEPVSLDQEPTLVVRYEPPAPLQEAPPTSKPADARALWIPGYWAWDDDRNNFIWVSGIWRVPPPNTRWVPGYWNPTPAGYQWVPGFWLATAAQPVEYLPAPPPTLEAGPVGVAPAPDAMWVQGCWIRQDSRYTWRPGFWAAGTADWIWVPAHYAWTPRGYVFCEGYWDYTIAARGVLFAPVACDLAFCTRPTFVYTPTIIIRLQVLITSLFSRPRYRHYYFGDYYDSRYARAGIRPWFDYRTDRRWYDPIGEHERWSRLRENPRWEDEVRGQYARRAAGQEYRPPRTFAAQQAELLRHPERARDALAAPLADLAARRNPPQSQHPREAQRPVVRGTPGQRWERETDARNRAIATPTPAPSVRTIPPAASTRTGGSPRERDAETRPVTRPAERATDEERPWPFAAPRATPRPETRPPAGGETRRPDAPAPAPRVETRPEPQRPAAPTVRQPTAPAPAPAPRVETRPEPQRPAAPIVRQPTAPAPAPAPREKTQPETRLLMAPPQTAPAPTLPSRVERRPEPQRPAAPQVRRPAAPAPAPAPRVETRPEPQRPAAPTVRQPTAPAPAPAPRVETRPEPQRPAAPAVRRPTAPAPAPAPAEKTGPETRPLMAPPQTVPVPTVRRPTAPAPAPAPRERTGPETRPLMAPRPTVPVPTVRRPAAPAPTLRVEKKPEPRSRATPQVRRPTAPAPAPAPRTRPPSRTQEGTDSRRPANRGNAPRPGREEGQD